MKIYETLKTKAEALELIRERTQLQIKDVNNDIRYSPVYKKEEVKKLINSYYNDVEVANKDFRKAIRTYIQETMIKYERTTPEKFLTILTLIRNLKEKPTDDELQILVEDIKNDFFYLKLLEKELITPEDTFNNGINFYPNTFKKLKTKELVDEELNKLKRFDVDYFIKDIKSSCIKYSLEEIKAIEEAIIEYKEN
ncbi:hypothetical protein [Fusobacterium mortiferum]|uniref:hypothetical protein n=1 Tax=Fusobacterium mortiferum TaxID=850 RepID=UPI00195A0B36|nr:hypothetical protein [Fusobacterium mortiferum]